MNLKNLLFVLILILPFLAFSQDESGYKFKDIKRLDATSVKDQYRSGTCWSFASISFLESEMLRMGKKDVPDLSEMFIVRQCYSDKAKRMVRLHGKLNFGGGGALGDVPYVLKNYGLVPEEIFSGMKIGETGHVHSEMDLLLKQYVEGVIENKNRKLSPAWHHGYEGILDAYLGAYPEKFTYKGKEYTPRTFADEFTGIKAEDYILITSYTHHPFYSTFAIEVPDNWLWDHAYNVKMDEMTEIMEHAINNGFTISWATDVSEKGFSYKNGVAVVSKSKEDLTDLERSKWDDMSSTERTEMLANLKSPGKEKEITQEIRQEAYDNYQTTDDHGMHIVGTAKDQNGTKYFIVKNSWNIDNPYGGYLYASESFVKYKTMSFMIHKDALSKEMKKKLKL